MPSGIQQCDWPFPCSNPSSGSGASGVFKHKSPYLLQAREPRTPLGSQKNLGISNPAQHPQISGDSKGTGHAKQNVIGDCKRCHAEQESQEIMLMILTFRHVKHTGIARTFPHAKSGSFLMPSKSTKRVLQFLWFSMWQPQQCKFTDKGFFKRVLHVMHMPHKL